MKKAYLYSRVSSDKQTKETSTGLQRQMEIAKSFLKSHSGYVLEETFIDAGISAYHGTNLAEDSGLSSFITACKAGTIEKGSLLIIEAPDRLSRLGIRDGIQLFDLLFDLEIDIGLVKYNTIMRHDDTNNLGNSLQLSSALYLGHLESLQKSQRIKESFEVLLENGMHPSGNYPKWLVLSEDRKSFSVHPIHGWTLKKIFELKLSGWGSMRIAAYLNKHLEQYPPITGKPKHTKSIIEKYLKSKAVFGTWERLETVYLEGKRKKGEAKELVENYFPSVISYNDWLRANNPLRKQQGKVSKEIQNIFRGLTFCGVCGKTRTYAKGKRGKAKLLCKGQTYENNGCCQARLNYQPIESAILKWLEGFDLNSLGTTKVIDTKEGEAKLIKLKEYALELENQLGDISNSKVLNKLVKQLEKTENEIAEINFEINQAVLKANDVAKPSLDLDNQEKRQAFNNALSKVIKHIAIMGDKESTLIVIQLVNDSVTSFYADGTEASQDIRYGEIDKSYQEMINSQSKNKDIKKLTEFLFEHYDYDKNILTKPLGEKEVA
ncbi:recombinase family protein [Pseudoalteromonas sp. G4]|uniref:recombinase family protein n=1 Tax=Pseudoalteromonas sp. G4 TaxID=2992761 RepID=UPI00237E05E7|nr:recombinase family protein [Pseudoalteromonas sp. G4]MDE3272739.1 recombinase family protein [Pseudoalteromonas sp. G4]